MGLVSARKNKTLYVMANANHFWLSTLATNRHDCWREAMRFCRTDNPRKELLAEGYRCEAVRLVDVIGAEVAGL